VQKPGGVLACFAPNWHHLKNAVAWFDFSAP